jgi:hypothetical protein
MVYIKNGASIASNKKPGDGWVGLGMVSQSASKFVLYWKNLNAQYYSRWDVDINDGSSNPVIITPRQFFADERLIGADLV